VPHYPYEGQGAEKQRPPESRSQDQRNQGQRNQDLRVQGQRSPDQRSNDQRPRDQRGGERHGGQPRQARHQQQRPNWEEQAERGKLEVETQPEIPVGQGPEPVQSERTPQAPKGYVVLAIGLPGSGKTTWFGRRGVTPLSSDLLRNILFDDVEEQRYQGLVFSTLRTLLRVRLIARMPWNYVDATNLSVHERRQWIKMAKGLGYEVQAVFFDVPLEVCLERNRQRDRSVSEEVMRRMAEKLKPPVFEEGFAKITVVRVKSAG